MSSKRIVWLGIVGLVALTGACALVGPSAAMSIEKADPQKPFKVTHKNSGPSYDTILDLKSENDGEVSDQVDKKRVASSEHEQPGVQASPEPGNTGARADDAEAPMGHITIRRIFLVPVAARPSDVNDELERQDGTRQRAPMGSPFGANPFWPMMSPSGGQAPSESEERPMFERPHRGHILPFGESAWQRNKVGDERAPAFDPIRMMIDLMHQAINDRLAPPLEPTDKVGDEKDLNKEASNGNNNSNSSSTSDGSLEKESEIPKRPLVQNNKPQNFNETTEEVVEIEGKKYLKKSVINRHVGENIVFMTRRLIFVPLNETNNSSTSTITPSATEEPNSTVSVKSEVEPTTTTTTTPTSTARPEREAATVVERKAETTEPAPSSTIANKETEPTTTTTAHTPVQGQQSNQEGNTNNKSTA